MVHNKIYERTQELPESAKRHYHCINHYLLSNSQVDPTHFAFDHILISYIQPSAEQH